MIKAIIFDCFGVLTTDAWIAFKKRHFRDDRRKAEKASELNHLAGSGGMNYKEFLTEVSALANMSEDEAEKEINTNVADDELFEYIKSLKPKYKIGMLSNAAANRLNKLFTQEQVSLFDEIVLSYEAGVIKPNELAYDLIANKLGLPVNECVLVDDQERHCYGANRAGMQAILYKDFFSFKDDLEKLLAAGADNQLPI